MFVCTLRPYIAHKQASLYKNITKWNEETDTKESGQANIAEYIEGLCSRPHTLYHIKRKKITRTIKEHQQQTVNFKWEITRHFLVGRLLCVFSVGSCFLFSTKICTNYYCEVLITFCTYFLLFHYIHTRYLRLL